MVFVVPVALAERVPSKTAREVDSRLSNSAVADDESYVETVATNERRVVVARLRDAARDSEKD